MGTEGMLRQFIEFLAGRWEVQRRRWRVGRVELGGLGKGLEEAMR